MKKTFKILGIIAISAVIVFSMTTCDNGGNNNHSNTYKGEDLGGNKYSLTFTETSRSAIGDAYTMEINSGGSVSTSSGTIVDILDDTYTLLPSSGSEEFTVTASGSVISSIEGNITLNNGAIFIVRTFETIYLRASRWSGFTETEGNISGENYGSGTSIKFKDIYEGDLDELLSSPYSGYTVRISGTVDRKLDFVRLYIHHAPIDWSEQWIWLGGSYNTIAIGPGNFETDIYFMLGEKDIEALPEGEVILQLIHDISQTNELRPEWDFAYEPPIPDDILNGTIMATVNNLKIEPAGNFASFWNSEVYPNSKTSVSISESTNNLDVIVTGQANDLYDNWYTQIRYLYNSINPVPGRTYTVSWKWIAYEKEFNDVIIFYAAQADWQDQHLYYLAEQRFTIPTTEEEKIFMFTLPENVELNEHYYIQFWIGEDTGSFSIKDFKIEESGTS